MNDQMDIWLDAALDACPQTPLPSGFVGRVMAQLKPVPVRFEFQFLDLAVSMFAAIFLVIIVLLLGQADWLALAVGQEGWLRGLWSDGTAVWLALTIAVAGELVLVGLLCLRLWGDPIDWLMG